MSLHANEISSPIRNRTVRYTATSDINANVLLKYTGSSGEEIDGNVKVYVINRTRNTFYGDKKPFEIRVYTSETNNEVKIYDRFAIQANTKPSVNDVRVSSISTPQGVQKSYIPANMIERIENGYYAPFMRDGLTYDYDLVSTDADYIRGLVNGNELRGNVLRLDLDYDLATDEITVFKVVIGSEISNI